jgi:hypothetical protein
MLSYHAVCSSVVILREQYEVQCWTRVLVSYFHVFVYHRDHISLQPCVFEAPSLSLAYKKTTFVDALRGDVLIFVALWTIEPDETNMVSRARRV